MPSRASPQEFFKSTVFGGKMNDNDVKRAIVTHAYVEGLNDTMGDFRFVSIEIFKDIWTINPARVTKAYRSLVDDGLLLPMGSNTSSGFPSFTKLSPAARKMIENTNKPSSAAPIPEAMYLDPPKDTTAPTAPDYVSSEVVKK